MVMSRFWVRTGRSIRTLTDKQLHMTDWEQTSKRVTVPNLNVNNNET